MRSSPYYPVSELALPELRLGRVRINPATYSISRQRGYLDATIKHIGKNSEIAVSGLPEGGIITNAVWYPDGEGILFACKEHDGVYLYSTRCSDGKVKKITNGTW